jgi:hypothetical protein
MPRWLGRLIAWATRRRRMVRVHFKPGIGDAPSISGYLRGRWGGHYVIELAKLHESVDLAVPVGAIEIPVANVLFLQVLTAVEP